MGPQTKKARRVGRALRQAGGHDLGILGLVCLGHVPFAAEAATSGRTDRNLYHQAVKTTLNLNDQLVADAKAMAAQQRTSLTRLIEEGLQLRLRAQASPVKPGRARLPVFKGRGGLVAGVNPLSNKSLLDALDDDA